MIKSKITRLFIAGTAGLLISCNTTNNSGLEQTINEVKDGQQVILKKIASLEKSIANIAGGSKNKPPQADPNQVYNVEIGDSFTIGPKNAKVTIIEWMDFQ